jgi:hypothetical protein
MHSSPSKKRLLAASVALAQVLPLVLYPKFKRVTVTVGKKTSVTLVPEELDGSEMVEQAVRLLWRVRRR